MQQRAMRRAVPRRDAVQRTARRRLARKKRGAHSHVKLHRARRVRGRVY